MTSTQLNQPSSHTFLAGIVLAAGRSSRFGSDKRFASFDQHDTLLSKSISIIEPCCHRIIVVTRPADAGQEQVLLARWWGHPKVAARRATDSDLGMGHSIANAIAHLGEIEKQQEQGFSGLVLMLADMPYIQPDTVTKIVAAHSMDNIVVPCYEYTQSKRRGHPVVFGRRWFDRLQRLEGDRGGRSVIVGNPSAVVEVAVDDPGILHDVDQPTQLLPP